MSELDSFAAKNAASARNWYTTNETSEKSEFKKRPRTQAAPKTGTCDRCKEEKLVKAFRVRETTVMNGAATFGTVIKYYCEDCEPKKRNEKDAPAGPSEQAVKNLKKSMKKLLR